MLSDIQTEPAWTDEIRPGQEVMVIGSTSPGELMFKLGTVVHYYPELPGAKANALVFFGEQGYQHMSATLPIENLVNIAGLRDILQGVSERLWRYRS